MPIVSLVGPGSRYYAPAQPAPTTFDYYIGPSGDNGNSGEEGAPWALSALESKTQIANSTVGLLDGTYVVQNSDFESAGVLVAEAGVTVQAVNPRQAIITGYNGASYSEQTLLGAIESNTTFKDLVIRSGARKLLLVDADDCTIDGCEIYDLDMRRAASPSYGDNVECIRIENFTNGHAPLRTLINNCKLYETRNASDGAPGNHNSSVIKSYDCDGLIVRQTTFGTAGAGAYMKYNSAGVTIERCFADSTVLVNAIIGIGGDEAWSQAGARTSYTNTVRYNVFLEQRHVMEAGVNAGQDQIAQYLEIYNNVFRSSAGSYTGGLTLRRGLSTGLLKIYNNILALSSSGYGQLRLASGASGGSGNAADLDVADYNRYPTSMRCRIDSTDYTTLANWRTATSKEAASSQGSAGFVNDGGTTPEDYMLDGGSACIGAGRVGGVSGGGAVDQGAWVSGVTQIGCDF